MKLCLEFDCFGASGIVTGLRHLLEGRSSAEAWMVAQCDKEGSLLREFMRIMVHTRDLWIRDRSLTSLLAVSIGPAAPLKLAEHETHQDHWTSYWLLPSYCPQTLDFAAAHLSAYLFSRAAHYHAGVFRMRADGEAPTPLAQAPALRRAWNAIETNSRIAVPTGAAVVCAELASDRAVPAQDALSLMEETAKARETLTIGQTRYNAEFWPGQLDVLSV